jgi:hypothetical protein
MAECECTEPGWCERHKMMKPAHWHHLCQTRENYRIAWDEGRGPGQLKATGESAPIAKTGLGDTISDALSAIGITEENYKAVKAKFGLSPTCGCAGRREWLNRVGRWLQGERE